MSAGAPVRKKMRLLSKEFRPLSLGYTNLWLVFLDDWLNVVLVHISEFFDVGKSVNNKWVVFVEVGALNDVHGQCGLVRRVKFGKHVSTVTLESAVAERTRCILTPLTCSSRRPKA